MMADTEMSFDREDRGEEPAEDEVETEAPELVYNEEEPNLVPIFLEHPEGEDILRKIADRVKTDFDDDWESTEEHRERRADTWKLFSGQLDPKDFPWTDCANGNIPIVLENISRLSARVYAEIFGSTKNVFGVLPVGPDDEEIARLLTHHGNWQLRNQIPDFFNQQHRGILMFFLWGDVVCHSTYDLERGQNHHEMLTCDEFVVPYTFVSTQPDFSDCPHRTRIRYMQAHQIERERGIWNDIDRILDRVPSYDDDPDAKFAESVREGNAIILPSGGSAAPYKLLEYEGWLPLPSQTRERFCRVVLDPHTMTIALLEIREEPNWEERIRFENETAEFDRYVEEKEAFDAGQDLERQTQEQMEADPNLLPEQKQEILATVASFGAPPAPPQPPMWMENPEDLEERPRPMRKSPVHMYSHGRCIDNLAGSLGLGLGDIEAMYNVGANTMFNQWVDGATLANCNTLLAHENIEFDDPTEMAPGKIMMVSGVEPGEMANGIMPMPRSPANPQLLEGVKMFEEWGQSAIQAPSVMSGEAGKSGETARGLTARIEQATKQTSVSAGRYADFLKQQLKNNAKLNSIFMPNEQFFAVNDHMGGREMLRIAKSAYRPNYAVEILSNLKFTPQQQKQMDADKVLQAVMGIPHTAQNPAIIYDAIVQFFEANEQEAMIPKLGRPPQPPQDFMPPPPPPPEDGGPPPQGPPPGA
jgi:hypothetical protein